MNDNQGIEDENHKILADIRFLFSTYDVKQKGHLNEKEQRFFLNDLRRSIGLDDLDDEFFAYLRNTIEKDKLINANPVDNGNPTIIHEKFNFKHESRLNEVNAISEEENSVDDNGTKKRTMYSSSTYVDDNIISCINEILLKIICISKKTKIKIKTAFEDFDIDCKGELTVNELKLLCHLECDRLGVVRSDDWQVEYLLSIIDDDGNGNIDLKEFYHHYREINEIQVQNRIVASIKKKKISFLSNAYHLGWSNEIRYFF